VNVVAGHYVIKYGKTEALLGLENTSADRVQTSVENSFDGSDSLEPLKHLRLAGKDLTS